jgi:starch synthase
MPRSRQRRPYGPPGVLVSHPVRQHSWATARALQRAGLLQAFVTSIDYDAGHGPYRLLEAPLLPSRLRARLHAQLEKRAVRIDDRSVVHTPGLWPLAITSTRPLLTKLGRSDLFTALLEDTFDYWVSRELCEARPRAVHCFEGSALRTFTRAKQLHIPCILDVASDHTGFVRVRQEEARALRESGALEQARRVDTAIHPKIYAERAIADYLLVPAHHIRDAVLADGASPDKIVMMPYGVDTEQFVPPATARQSAGRFTALFVGKLGMRKGEQFLLRAWEELRLEDAELVLVGGGEVGLIEALRINGNPTVRWAGNVPHSMVLKYYQEADIFVLPSLCEGSALVIYEAMACGSPVITTPTAGSIVRDGVDGYIVPSRDVGALKDRIEALYRDRAALRCMGKNARERVVQSYTWKHYEQRLAAFYREVVFRDRASADMSGQHGQSDSGSGRETRA